MELEVIKIDYVSNPPNPLATILRNGIEKTIEFDSSGEVIGYDAKERVRTEILIGQDEDDNMYSAIAEFVCDELDVIRDIDIE